MQDVSERSQREREVDEERRGLRDPFEGAVRGLFEEDLDRLLDAFLAATPQMILPVDFVAFRQLLSLWTYRHGGSFQNTPWHEELCASLSSTMREKYPLFSPRLVDLSPDSPVVLAINNAHSVWETMQHYDLSLDVPSWFTSLRTQWRAPRQPDEPQDFTQEHHRKRRN